MTPLETGSGRPPVAWGAALLLITGSLLFLAGGRVHPAISATLGADASQFFFAFAEKVRSTNDWNRMHMMILIGPLFWATGAPTLLDVLRPEAGISTSAARSALVLSAALWAVAFVLDGFGAPVYAEALSSSSTDKFSPVLSSFQANAIMMSRLGLLSLIVGGLGVALIGASLLDRDSRTLWRTTVGVSGVLIGLWPLAAALQGEYAGGPFTSAYWRLNAVALAAWFLGLAACAFARAPSKIQSASAGGGD